MTGHQHADLHASHHPRSGRADPRARNAVESHWRRCWRRGFFLACVATAPIVYTQVGVAGAVVMFVLAFLAASAHMAALRRAHGPPTARQTWPATSPTREHGSRT